MIIISLLRGGVIAVIPNVGGDFKLKRHPESTRGASFD